MINWLCGRPRMTKAALEPRLLGSAKATFLRIWSQSSTRSRFRHGKGVPCAKSTMARNGEAAMSVVLNDLLLFSCLTVLVIGIVIAALRRHPRLIGPAK